MKKPILILSVIFSVLISISSCEKDDVPSAGISDTQAVQDDSKHSAEWTSVDEVVKRAIAEAYIQQGPVKSASAITADNVFSTNCDSVVLDLDSGKVHVYFIGECACSKYDSRTREGALHVEFTGAYLDPGTVINTVTDNFVIDDYGLDGQRRVTNNGGSNYGGGDTLEFAVEVGDVGLTGGYGTISYPGGGSSTWKSSRTRLLVSDNDSPTNFLDDFYQVWGTASGVDKNGRAYTMSVDQTDPLYYDLTCWLTSFMPKSGTLTISPADLDDRIIDYGYGGGCDRAITISVGTISVNLTL